MDIIDLTRKLGKLIQEDERYIKLQITQQNSDNDAELQKLIGDFNLKRMNVNTEASKDERDENKIQKLNDELRELYSEIMQNATMIAYNEAKQEFDVLLNRINAIIIQSAQGEDPETADYQESCSGSCSSCSGCN